MNMKINKKVFEMYDADLKERFLEDYGNPGTNERYRKAFNKTRDFEELNNKDLYEFNLIEITDMLTAFNSKSLDTLRSYRAIFSRYVDFCIRNNCLVNGNLLTQNIYDNINDKFLNTLIGNLPKKNRYLKHWDEYKDILDLPHTNQNINYQDIVIFVFLINGIKAVDMPYIRMEDINENDRSLHHTREYKKKIKGKDVLIHIEYNVIFSEKEMNILTTARLEQKYISVGTKNDKEFVRSSWLQDSRYIIKSTMVGEKKNAEDKVATQGLINRRVRNIGKLYLENMTLSSDSIYKSGKFLRLHDLEMKLDRPIEGRDIPKEFKVRYGLSNTNISSLLKNYRLWKKIKD